MTRVTAVWQVMTPIKDRVGSARWFKPLIVAKFEHEARAVAEQQAGAGGFSFDGDIEVQHVRNAIE